MEKISIKSTYTQVSLYARYSGPASAKKPGAADAADASAAAADAADPKNGELGRSRDGDTFSLSIEARTLQISESITIESDAAADAPAAADKPGKTAAQGRLAGSGMVTALMDALKTLTGSSADASKGSGQGKRRHHFPQLADPADVADMFLSRLDQDHAAKGGSKQDFAADAKKRLGDWKASSSSRITVEYQEFRSEVHLKLTAGLDAWLAQGTGDDSAAAPPVVADPAPPSPPAPEA